MAAGEQRSPVDVGHGYVRQMNSYASMEKEYTSDDLSNSDVFTLPSFPSPIRENTSGAAYADAFWVSMAGKYAFNHPPGVRPLVD